MKIFTIPDIHGNIEGLNKALDKIFSVWNEFDKIVFLGDYIDRGENSYAVVQKLYDLQKEYGKERIICLMGNHDDMFLKFLKNKFDFSFLINDTGLKTIKSFLGNTEYDLYLQDSIFLTDLKTMSEVGTEVIKEINKKHSKLIEWYKDLPLYYDRIYENNVLFVHAGIEESVISVDWKEYTTRNQMLWKYPATYGVNPYGFNILSGHIMVDDLWKFSQEPRFDMFVSGNHYYLDSASPFNKELNIAVVEQETIKEIKDVFKEF